MRYRLNLTLGSLTTNTELDAENEHVAVVDYFKTSGAVELPLGEELLLTVTRVGAEEPAWTVDDAEYLICWLKMNGASTVTRGTITVTFP